MSKLNSLFAATVALSAVLAAPAFAETIAVGGSVTGALATTDERNDERSSFMDSYEITLSGGQAVDIRMASEEFDTYLNIGMLRTDYFEAYDYNDDFGGSLNSRLRFVAPEGGT